MYSCLMMLYSHTMQHHPPTAICNTLWWDREKERDRESRVNQVELTPRSSICLITFEWSFKPWMQLIQFKILQRSVIPSADEKPLYIAPCLTLPTAYAPWFSSLSTIAGQSSIFSCTVSYWSPQQAQNPWTDSKRSTNCQQQCQHTTVSYLKNKQKGSHAKKWDKREPKESKE